MEVKVSTKSSSGGVGFVGLLTIVFIALKLLNVISWSWWWVLSPLWISAGLVVAILVFLFLFWLVVELLDHRNMKKHKNSKRNK